MPALESNPRLRGLLVGLALVLVSVGAGHAIYSGRMRFLGLLGLFTIVVLLRRWSFVDFYLMTLMALTLGHVRIEPIQSEFDVDKWLALAAMGGLAALVPLARLHRPQWPRTIHLLVLALIAVAVLSYQWSVRPTWSLMSAGVLGIGLVVAFVGVWSWTATTEDAWRVVNAHADWLWAVYPVALALSWVPGSWVTGRLRSVFQNANNLGVWASVALPLLFGLMLTHPVRWRRWSCGALLLAGLGCVFASRSRGGLFAAAGGIFVYSLLRWPRRVLAGVALVAVVVAFLHGYEVDVGDLTERVQDALRLRDLEALSGRRVAWEAADVVGAQRPWLGYGFATSGTVYALHGLVELTGRGELSTHSTYYDAYLGLGRLGLWLTVGVVGLGVAAGLRAWWSDRRGSDGLMALALTASVLSLAAHGAVEMIFLSVGNPWSLPFWVHVALATKMAVLLRARVSGEVRAEKRAPVRQAPVAA